MPAGVNPPDWTFEDAKARFEEVVRRAQNERPQTVTIGNRKAVVVLSAEQYQRLCPLQHKVSLVEFLESLDFKDLDTAR